MEHKETLIKEIQEIIEKHGTIHCYEGIIGSCIPLKPTYLNLGVAKVVDGVFYEDSFKVGFMQGFHYNNVTIVKYKNAKPFDTFSVKYTTMSIKYLTECLNFLRRG